MRIKIIAAIALALLLCPLSAHASFVAAGLDFTKGVGVVLVESAPGELRALELPPLHGKWYITGAASQPRGGGVLLLGADRGTGQGLLLRLDGDKITPLKLPRLEGNWMLTAGTFVGADRALLVGYDQARGLPIALAGQAAQWSFESFPATMGRIELLDVDGTHELAFAAGVNRSTNKGALFVRQSGTWSELNVAQRIEESFRFEGLAVFGGEALIVGSAGQVERGLIVRVKYDGQSGLSFKPELLPEVSRSWTLYDVWAADDGSTAVAVGSDLSNRRGILLEYSAGKWSSAIIDDNVELIAVVMAPGNRLLAVGQDQVRKQGVAYLREGRSWRRLDLPEVSFNWLLTGAINR
ncbi:MAG: hypothetical protein P9M14_15835 [Candidatus Alcyoniella australis]|nr:hypothetical protein [Candidatus Alcyoniella australis]